MSREYPAAPMIGVGVIVWHDDRILLVKRGRPPRAGEWSLPGGRMELGETVAQTAIREVAEECGIAIGSPEVLEVVDLIDRDPDGAVRYHYVLIDVIAPWISGDARAGDDAAEVRWVTRQELADLGLWGATRRVLERAFARLSGSPGSAPR